MHLTNFKINYAEDILQARERWEVASLAEEQNRQRITMACVMYLGQKKSELISLRV